MAQPQPCQLLEASAPGAAPSAFNSPPQSRTIPADRDVAEAPAPSVYAGGRERRAYSRVAVSFPIEYGILPRFRHWTLRPTYRSRRSSDRNPTGSLAVPEPEPWAVPYLSVARFIAKLFSRADRRSWEDEGKIEPASCLDLSEGGVRMATSYPLWLGATVRLRIPSHELAPFGYTVLGKVVRVAPAARDEIEVGIGFTAIHQQDQQGLLRFITTPQPQLAALRRQHKPPAPALGR